ncbi:MAG TPA: hypothetical protein VE420_00895, partial [Gemmatimonadales bacterium]|nr:hypothetical protein [Gemmatimonadales bacterium]
RREPLVCRIEEYHCHPALGTSSRTVRAGCVILPGVHIGRGAVVGANSVVVSSVPALHVVAGQPARTVRELVPSAGWQ